MYSYGVVLVTIGLTSHHGHAYIIHVQFVDILLSSYFGSKGTIHLILAMSYSVFEPQGII